MTTASESALLASIENLLEGVQIIAFDWTYLYVNDTACQHGQRTSAELLGRTLHDCHPGIDKTEMFAALERVMDTRRSERILNEFVFPDGERGWFELLIDAVPSGICVLSLDISDRQRVQAQLRQAQKMEAVGRLAGGIAHDFNNLLTAILGYCELILDREHDDQNLIADMQEIRAAGERASRLTRQLLAFSRKQVLVPQVLDLNQVVLDLDRMLTRVIGEDVRLEILTGPGLHNTKADPGQIEQVLLNLVVNARDAMPQGGTIRIATANVELDDRFTRQHQGAVTGHYVSLVVEDTGCGIAPEVLPQVFEPFFTTKGPGKGTGLGLATVYGIVKQSAGYISIESTVGLGTAVSIYLPVVADPVEARVVQPAAALIGGVETILLAEDELRVRELMCRTLSQCGYNILEAKDVADAIALAGSHREGIDLLLTDIVMPVMNGPNLAQLLLRDHPSMKVLYVSGFPHTVVAGSPSTSARIAILAKPFGPKSLAAAVRQCLDGTAAA